MILRYFRICPKTILSGFRKSDIAEPSLKNSGFIPKAILGNDCKGYFALTFFVITELTVPGGTVLLIIIEIFCFKFDSNGIIDSIADSTKFKSQLSSSKEGVPTQINIISVPFKDKFLRSMLLKSPDLTVF